MINFDDLSMEQQNILKSRIVKAERYAKIMQAIETWETAYETKITANDISAALHHIRREGLTK